MTRLLLLPSFALFACYAAVGGGTSSAPVVTEEGARVTLRNNYLRVTFDRARHSIVSLAADFAGKRSYGDNLLAEPGIVLEVEDSSGKLLTVPEDAPASYRILERRDGLRVLFETQGQAGEPEWSARWTITLGKNDRGFQLDTLATFHPKAQLRVARLRFYLRQWFLNGLYDKGAVQYIAGRNEYFSSTSALREFYTMDRRNGSVAIIPDASNEVLESNLLSGEGPFASGLEQVLAGSSNVRDRWSGLSGRQFAGPAVISTAVRAASYRIYPNNRPFPVHRITTGPNMTADDLEAYTTAIYGAAAAVLGSYTVPGSAYPTLATPLRPYGDAYNFFDPDAWSNVAALSFSGDPVLHQEARKILETSERCMKPDGQMPHHFEASGPTYISIAKSSQTGPNIFWILAAVDYVTGTGDEAWLKLHFPTLRRSADWLLTYYDPKRSLLSVRGPLFIDTFRREHFTLDTNVMMVRLLHLLAPVAEYCGDAQGAKRFADYARKIAAGVNEGLWDGQDHFVTQRNADWSIRDKVDYDGNYAALAFGIVPGLARRRAIVERLDRGPHTHPNGRGTWVSERRYEPEDCYLRNDGDSDTAMARIWWLDMAVRYRMGDLAAFENMLGRTRSDLLAHTWMGERYDAAGQFAHHPYYHEYPEILGMVLREMRYGIDVKIDSVTIRPFGLDHYDFSTGDLTVHYERSAVRVRVPGTNVRTYRIHGLLPQAKYQLSTGGAITTGRDGVASFRAPAGIEVAVKHLTARK
jgi:hypothetical protein